ncbi:MAG: leucine-rich repeat protein [Ruminococcus sp.]|nr:leucine-rich repeat protein [Ruminococcus sp.]MDE6785350.1 leucine-rich repeat protein [Ruminococcus sp.]
MSSNLPTSVITSHAVSDSDYVHGVSEEYNLVYYIVNGDHIEITGRADRGDYPALAYFGPAEFPDDLETFEIVIPSEIDGLPVTSIESSAFYHDMGLSKITLPDTLVTIGQGAFLHTALESVDIPECVKKIEARAFHGCTRLKDVTIPSTVEYIGYEAFEYTAWQDGLPDGITYVNNILYRCSGDIKELDIKEGTETICPSALKNCTNVESVIFPDSIKDIAHDTFDKTEWFNNLPDGTYYINDMLYTYKGEAPENGEIIVREGTKEIMDGAFSNRKDIVSVVLPEGLEKIGNCAFDTCQGLKEINLPESLTYIGSSAFQFTGIENIKIPSGVKNIKRTTFNICRSLQEVILPETLETIDFAAFSNCESLESINIPYGVREIGIQAFEDCKALTSIMIPDSVEVIDNSAFETCWILEEITIPDSVQEIGDYAFQNCWSLKKITLPEHFRERTEKLNFYNSDIEIIFTPENSVKIMSATLAGDSNCDGELTVADATLILQYLGNSDKYRLSEQGAVNADIAGENDGISALDALQIQKILAE